MEHSMQGHHYRRLLVMMVLSFIAMYVLMYAMVDRLPNVFNSINQVYMAGLMAAAMLIIELLAMGGMYPQKRWNEILIVVGIVALVGFWLAIRQQAAVGDQQFLKSMIPHHAGAILMCQQAQLTDPELKTLCESIITGQQSEIDQMKALLERKQ
jgi:uncharacterized protein (DUF305 family)